jgi:hypothetical protein
LPFFVVAPRATAAAFRHTGIPGFGGLSLMLQPSLAGWWRGSGAAPNFLSRALDVGQGLVATAIVLALTLFLFYVRPTPVEGCVVVWLAVYALAPNFAPWYLVWGLPFFVMARRIKLVVVLEAFLLIPLIILYTVAPLIDLYRAMMLMVAVGFLVALGYQVRNMVKRRNSPLPQVATTN